MEQVISFFTNLQSITPLLEIFSDQSFRTSVVFPYVRVEPNFKLFLKSGKIKHTPQLTLPLLNKTQIIVFDEIVEYHT